MPLAILGRGRLQVLAGLAGTAAAALGLAVSVAGADKVGRLASPSGALAIALGAALLVAAAALFVRRPGWVPVAVLVAAPFRPPITLQSGGGFPLTLARDGQLGRLLPLYFVLAAATLALAWLAARAEGSAAGPTRALPRVVATPLAAFVALAALSLFWAEDLGTGAQSLAYFTVPFALLATVVARSPYPEWAPRRLGQAGVALAVLFAAVGLEQAVTQKLFFFAPSVETSNANSSFFRVTSLFGDPSLYGRHVVLGLALVLVALALSRVDVRLGVAAVAVLWAGLFFSYSQSSMVALVAVTLALAAVTGTREVRRAVAVTCALVALAGAGFLASVVIRGQSLRQETSDRTQRVQDTVRVVRAEPVRGVGVGNQPRATRRLSGRDRPTANFVSHTTPLTVAAELGLLGLGVYVWLLAGAARAIEAVRRLDPVMGLGLGAALLVLFVHGLFYPGFLEDPITWLVLGVSAGYLSWPRRDDGVHPAHRPHGAVA